MRLKSRRLIESDYGSRGKLSLLTGAANEGGGDQLQTYGFGDGVHPSIGLQFPEDLVPVKADGARAYIQNG